MRRGEVWWVRFPAPSGPRPAVILTRNEVVNSLDNLVVALVTTHRRNIPSELTLGRREGLPRQSVASMDNILTVSRQRFVEQLGALSAERIVELDQVLKYALAIQ